MPSEVSEREQKVLNIIETARAKRSKFRDAQITMAHGAGGKATATLIEGLLAPAFGLGELADAAAVDGLAVTTDSFRPLWEMKPIPRHSKCGRSSKTSAMTCSARGLPS